MPQRTTEANFAIAKALDSKNLAENAKKFWELLTQTMEGLDYIQESHYESEQLQAKLNFVLFQRRIRVYEDRAYDTGKSDVVVRFRFFDETVKSSPKDIATNYIDKLGNIAVNGTTYHYSLSDTELLTNAIEAIVKTVALNLFNDLPDTK